MNTIYNRPTYAGIGSREITDQERVKCLSIAREMQKLGWVLYSGNAIGADNAFQIGSLGANVQWLPWAGYNNHQNDELSVKIVAEHYSFYDSGQIKNFTDWENELASASIRHFHPNVRNLTDTGFKFMYRNWFIINGAPSLGWQPVQFVVCCATPVPGSNDVVGGTGQGVRIARAMGIPVYNVRTGQWITQKQHPILNQILTRIA